MPSNASSRGVSNVGPPRASSSALTNASPRSDVVCILTPVISLLGGCWGLLDHVEVVNTVGTLPAGSFAGMSSIAMCGYTYTLWVLSWCLLGRVGAELKSQSLSGEYSVPDTCTMHAHCPEVAQTYFSVKMRHFLSLLYIF